MPAAGKSGIMAILLAALIVATPAAAVAFLDGGKQSPVETAVIYQYDARAQRWVNQIAEIPPQPGSAARPGMTNTLIIRLQEGNPVREITIDQALIIGGAEPLFQIDGDPSGFGSGNISIGTLTFDKVDAARLEIVRTGVVSSSLTNVVARDNELELSMTTGNVTFVGRGANSLLSFEGVRFDRLRILGPGGENVHLERLNVTRSSVFGRIEIKDVEIQELVLKDVSLDDFTSP